jgi:hypothetical protein
VSVSNERHPVKPNFLADWRGRRKLVVTTVPHDYHHRDDKTMDVRLALSLLMMIDETIALHLHLTVLQFHQHI